LFLWTRFSPTYAMFTSALFTPMVQSLHVVC
jgi:hypothetical protein